MTPPETEKRFRSYVPDKTDLREFTFRAVMLGLLMTGVLGAANAYLGLKAGMTIAATYPAAVIGMALLRLMGGSLLEENIARTVGSIGESVAAGAVFTVPAFVLSGAWKSFDTPEAYWKSTVLMLVGGILGILFVTLLRRVMVEDPELPYPESVAASEIHKAGQQGSRAASLLFQAMGFGAALYFLGAMNLYSQSRDFIVRIGTLGRASVRLGNSASAPVLSGWCDHRFRARRQPGVSRGGLHHRAALGGAQLFRRRHRLGADGTAVDLFPRPAAAGHTAAGRQRRSLGRPERSRVAFHRAADCGRGNAGGRLLHAVPHAGQPAQRDTARRRGLEEIQHAARIHAAH